MRNQRPPTPEKKTLIVGLGRTCSGGRCAIRPAVIFIGRLAMRTETKDFVTCLICGNRRELESAIDAGWEPQVRDGDDSLDPICEVCAKEYSHVALDGEVVLNLFVDVAAEQRRHRLRLGRRYMA